MQYTGILAVYMPVIYTCNYYITTISSPRLQTQIMSWVLEYCSTMGTHLALKAPTKLKLTYLQHSDQKQNNLNESTILTDLFMIVGGV